MRVGGVALHILVVGGAGYVGSHAVKALLEAGHTVAVLDNLSKGHRWAVPAAARFVEGDIQDGAFVKKLLRAEAPAAVMHFAADSLVGESMAEPARYYRNNIAGTLSLLVAMRETGVAQFVFSSTAAVYGEPAQWPITEDFPLGPTNVYGRTKLAVEWMLADFAAAYGLRYVSLRYFNAAGAQPDGSIGEDHNPETHLIPLILAAALGRRDCAQIFGTDYPTPDGTCIRDYVHVTDLATAHVLAVEHLGRGGGSKVYNLGSETGFSVRQVIERAKDVTGVDFPVREAPRRPGDPAVLVASSARIRNELGWRPVLSDLATIISTAWKWHKSRQGG